MVISIDTDIRRVQLPPSCTAATSPEAENRAGEPLRRDPAEQLHELPRDGDVAHDILRAESHGLVDRVLVAFKRAKHCTAAGNTLCAGHRAHMMLREDITPCHGRRRDRDCSHGDERLPAEVAVTCEVFTRTCEPVEAGKVLGEEPGDEDRGDCAADEPLPRLLGGELRGRLRENFVSRDSCTEYSLSQNEARSLPAAVDLRLALVTGAQACRPIRHLDERRPAHEPAEDVGHRVVDHDQDRREQEPDDTALEEIGDDEGRRDERGQEDHVCPRIRRELVHVLALLQGQDEAHEDGDVGGEGPAWADEEAHTHA